MKLTKKQLKMLAFELSLHLTNNVEVEFSKDFLLLVKEIEIESEIPEINVDADNAAC